MLKVAILDDYQNVAQQFVDLEKLSGKYEFKIFSEPFLDEADTIEQLARQNYGFVRPGEEAYAVPPPAPEPVRLPANWPFTHLAQTLGG